MFLELIKPGELRKTCLLIPAYTVKYVYWSFDPMCGMQTFLHKDDLFMVIKLLVNYDGNEAALIAVPERREGVLIAFASSIIDDSQILR